VQLPKSPDHLVSDVTFQDGVEVTRDDFEYTGVAAGEEGTRTRTTVHTPPFEDLPPSGFINFIAFTYDSRGLLVEEIIDEEDEGRYTITYEYRDDGRISRLTSNVGDLPFERTFRYDEAGNLLAIEWFVESTGEVLVETYEY
jgi:hypothetical protein